MARESQEVQKLKKEFYEGMLRFDQGMEKLRKEREETEKLLKDLMKAKERTDRQLKITDRQIKETSKQIKNLGKQIGELTNGWDKFVEAQVQPAIPKLFRGLGINRSSHTLKARRNGKEIEVDAVGIGDQALVIVSIKSRLRKEDVDQLLQDILRFPSFFPEFKGKAYYGAVAGIRIDKGVPEYAEKQGLYVLGPSGESVKLLNKKGFKPRVW